MVAIAAIGQGRNLRTASAAQESGVFIVTSQSPVSAPQRFRVGGSRVRLFLTWVGFRAGSARGQFTAGCSSPRLLSVPASSRRVASSNPDLDRLCCCPGHCKTASAIFHRSACSRTHRQRRPPRLGALVCRSAVRHCVSRFVYGRTPRPSAPVGVFGGEAGRGL